MSTLVTIAELRSMQIADLRKDLRAQQTLVAKMRLQIEMNTEKDTGHYRREKRQIARMQMVLGEKQKSAAPAKASKPAADQLKTKAPIATVPVSKKKSVKRSS